ncbi:hypothetical protein [Aureivirga sp. CE67]|uniref:hypothetical protein n=1 Tax=Aureivirga sp. CE67 TaxID=1788983 RepID=UPI0018CBA7D7|nr:hypothetical protein [Aureivirga sp. CE67]
MEKIYNFITEFVRNDYEIHRTKYDISLSDENHDKLSTKLNSYIHPYLNYNQNRVRKVASVLNDQVYLNRFSRKINKIIPRTLFQIKHYQHPELGSSLESIIKDDDLWACYLSYDQQGGRDLYFSSIFFVANTNKGLKIIYKMSFDSDNGEWYHPHNGEVLQVLNPGTLISVEKYQAPEEETSLMDYNTE